MRETEVIHETPWGLISEMGPDAIRSDQATRLLLAHFSPGKNDRIVEIGCGTGVISIGAALAGAREVIGTDIDPAAMTAASANALANGCPQIQFKIGHLLEPVAGPVDLVVGNLPHRPAPHPFNPRYYGGRDGTDVLLQAVDEAHKKLVTGGRLVLYKNGIANPGLVMKHFQQGFSLRLRAERKRYFSREEFEGLLPGLFDHLQVLRKSQEAEIFEEKCGFFYWGRVWEGRKM